MEAKKIFWGIGFSVVSSTFLFYRLYVFCVREIRGIMINLAVSGYKFGYNNPGFDLDEIGTAGQKDAEKGLPPDPLNAIGAFFENH